MAIDQSAMIVYEGVKHAIHSDHLLATEKRHGAVARWTEQVSGLDKTYEVDSKV